MQDPTPADAVILQLETTCSVRSVFLNKPCMCTYAAIQATALTFDPKVFDGEDVLHLRYVSPAVKLFLAPVPLVDNRPLGAAGQDQVGFVGDLQIFYVRVPVPRVE